MRSITFVFITVLRKRKFTASTRKIMFLSSLCLRWDRGKVGILKIKMVRC